jgi:pimeloyl-ACP methyl ester carboxylesterase
VPGARYQKFESISLQRREVRIHLPPAVSQANFRIAPLARYRFGRRPASTCALGQRRPAIVPLRNAKDYYHSAGQLHGEAELVEVPEARHHVMLDHPLAFVAALRTLLDSWMRNESVEGSGHIGG